MSNYISILSLAIWFKIYYYVGTYFFFGPSSHQPIYDSVMKLYLLCRDQIFSRLPRVGFELLFYFNVYFEEIETRRIAERLYLLFPKIKNYIKINLIKLLFEDKSRIIRGLQNINSLFINIELRGIPFKIVLGRISLNNF